MKILEQPMAKKDLLKSEYIFDDVMVKGVVDVERELIGIDAEMSADIEKMFLENGSNQDALWGINLYPEDDGDDFVEFDSMINIRPRQNNRSRDVEDLAVRRKILEVVGKWFN